VNKCVIGDLLVTHFNNVWVGGWAKSDFKAFGRLLCSRPKAKIPQLSTITTVLTVCHY
jgi:hypothetical protein